MTSADVEGPVPKKRKMEQEILVAKAAVNTLKIGHCFYFTSSSNITLNFSEVS